MTFFHTPDADAVVAPVAAVGGQSLLGYGNQVHVPPAAVTSI
jgi:hypothetical protein